MAQPLMHDSVWRDQQKFEAAEAFYQAHLAGTNSLLQTSQGVSMSKIYYDGDLIS